MSNKKLIKAVFSANLKRLITHNRLTQASVSNALGTTPRTLRRWLDPNDDHWPHASLLPQIATMFDCSLDDLFEHDPSWLPQTRLERELLMVAREVAPGIGREITINALSMALGRLSPQKTKLWLEVGEAFKHK